MSESEREGVEQIKKIRARWTIYLIGLSVVLIFCVLLSIYKGGSANISVSEIIDILLGNKAEDNRHYNMIWESRLPRTVMALFVGAGLAVSGVAMQGLFRNPMASPYILGLSSGAAFGASLSMVLGLSFLPGALAIPSMAFIFCLITLLIVYNIARIGGRVPMETLLLAGIAVGAFFSALVNLMTYIAGEKMEGIVFWMMGDLSQNGWSDVQMVIPMVLIGASIIMYYSRDLNAMMLGDNHAQNLGIEVGKVRLRILVACALATAAAVSFVGIIGFVGLVVPHVMRIIVGPDHRILVPASVLAGGSFLILADILARWVMHPQILPIGILTALIGAPYFIYLLRRKRKEVGW